MRYDGIFLQPEPLQKRDSKQLSWLKQESL